MQPVPSLLSGDARRLAALAAAEILDTPAEPGFDDVVRLATRLCAAPIALVSFVAADRQWFKARVGFPDSETDLDRSICKFVLAEPDLLVIPDLTRDERTCANPLVTGGPGIRFYAGAPLQDREGAALGSLCVIDTEPRPTGLTAEQADDLRALARQVMSLLEARRVAADERHARAQSAADAARLEALIGAQLAIATAAADIDAIFAAVVETALRVIGIASGAVVELREGESLVYRAASGTSVRHLGTRLPLHGTLSGRALLGGAPLHCADTEADPEAEHEHARQLAIRSMVCAPMLRQGVAIGVLKVQSGEPDAFSPRDVMMTQMLAGLVASGFGAVAEVQTRAALEEAETRYKAIFDSAIDFAIIAADAQERITDWNAGAERILGWRADEVRGRTLDVFFTPEDRAEGVPEKEERGALLAGSSDDERWHVRADGERFWAVGRMMTLRREGEGVRGYLKILQDRSRERRRQQGLELIARASEALLSAGDPAGMLLPILAEGAEALGFDQSYTWDVDADGAQLLLTHSVGVDEATRTVQTRVPLDVPVSGIVARTGRPLVLERLLAGDDPRHAIARAAGIDAYAGFPVMSHGRVAGVLSFAACREPAFDGEMLAFFATIARFLSLARERSDAAAALHGSEERLRLAQEAGRIGTFEIDSRSDVLSASPEFCRTYGLPPSPAFPTSVVQALVLRDDIAMTSTGRSRADGSADPVVEYRIRRADDGRLRWIARRAEFERDGAGCVVRMLGTVQDVTDRRSGQAMQTALVGLGDRLRGAATTAEVVETSAEVLGRTLSLSRAGYARVDKRLGRLTIERDWAAPGVKSLAGTHDLAAFRGTLAEIEDGYTLTVANIPALPALRSDVATYEAIGTRAQVKVPLLDGDVLVGLVYAHQAEPRTWSKDEVAFVHGVADRTYAALSKVRAEAEQRVLNQELSHRMKNSFAMVQAIAGQTLRGVQDRAPVEAFTQRLQALSRAHDVLLQQSWAAADLREVVTSVLRAVSGIERFDVSGPEMVIGPRATLSLSLLLHELSTNATKYGALSVESGRVGVGWQVTDAANGPDLVLNWTEIGGPPAVEPDRKGFGSRLIRMGLVGAGGTELQYLPSGLHASFKAPLDQARSL